MEQPAPPLPLCHNTEKTYTKPYIDNLTLLEKISLSNLEKKVRIIGPPPFHGCFHLEMPKQKSIILHQLQDLVNFTKKCSMVLNSSKTKCLPSRTKNFMPELSVEKDTYLEVIYSLKLVGLVIMSDLCWQAHVYYTITRVNKVLWQLTRFKQLGASTEKLVVFSILKIRSILMFASACFHSALTSEQRERLELQQKRSLAIILGSNYRKYEHARKLLNLASLNSLRESVCLKWAVKAAGNPQHNHLFPLNQSRVITRNQHNYFEYRCKGNRLYHSAVPAIVRSLNQRYSSKLGSQQATKK